MRLSELHSKNFGKTSDKWQLYLQEYDSVFQGYRNKAISTLEIGVQNGGFLQILAEYFPNAKKLIGVDVNEKVGQLKYVDPRVSVIVGDCNSLGTLEAVKKISGGHIDIVIDDGSHTSRDIILAFCSYFPLVSVGGVYVVEDIHCSYWAEFGGGLYDPYSSISFFKGLVDVINYEHWGLVRDRGELIKKFGVQYGFDIPDGLLESIHSIKFINSLCIIEKNIEENNVLGARRVLGESQDIVCVEHLANTYSQALSQENSQWSSLENSQIGALEHKNYLMSEVVKNALIKDRALQEKKDELEAISAEREQLKARVQMLESKILKSDQQVEFLNAEKHRYVDECNALVIQLNDFQKSLTWRATTPIRRFFEQVGVSEKVRKALDNRGTKPISIPSDIKETVNKSIPVTRFRQTHEMPKTLFNATNVAALNSVSKSAPQDYQIEIPVVNGVTPSLTANQSVGIFLHAFHEELVVEAFELLKRIDYKFQLYVTTDSEVKSEFIKKSFNQIEMQNSILVVKIVPNRGRDIAPRLVWLKDEIKSVDLALFIHTKKSPHIGGGASWRDYLWRALFGSDLLVKSIINIFENNKKLGVLCPAHWAELTAHQPINWGYNFPEVQRLAEKLGGSIFADTPLDFPSGSMFWFRTDALKFLVSDKLTLDDFEEESGQVDGTFAHAIERSIFYICELAGYFWIKYQPTTDNKLDLSRLNLEDTHYRLLGNEQNQSNIGSRIPESVVPQTRPSSSTVRRITLLIPTLQRAHIFGGITTAVSFFTSVLEKLSDLENIDARIIVTDDEYGLDQRYLQITDLKLNTEKINLKIQSLKDILHTGQLDVRVSETFISSAWWNAAQMQKIQMRAILYFGKCSKNIYLIQDYEPGFYAWSSKTAIADATYWSGTSEIKVINDSFLADFMAERGVSCDVVVPFGINDSIAKAIAEIGEVSHREKIIIFYGRPSVERNCFDLILDGLANWACCSPYEFSSWRIISLGELYAEELLPPILMGKIEIIGKLPLYEYASLLTKAKVGISFMESPHPSYPPQEMMYAGMTVVVNNWHTKRWHVRDTDYVVVKTMNISDVSAAIREAIVRAQFGDLIENRQGTPLQSEINRSVAETVVRFLD